MRATIVVLVLAAAAVALYLVGVALVEQVRRDAFEDGKRVGLVEGREEADAACDARLTADRLLCDDRVAAAREAGSDACDALISEAHEQGRLEGLDSGYALGANDWPHSSTWPETRDAWLARAARQEKKERPR